jgi:hypothetical protein
MSDIKLLRYGQNHAEELAGKAVLIDSSSRHQPSETESFLAALVGGLSEDFPNEIDETDLGIDTPRRKLD